MERYDAIVVGVGIIGLLAALTLSKHGKRVLVLEKRRYVGGNCNSYAVDGFQVDTGPHAITHLVVGPLKRLMDNYFNHTPVFEDHGYYYVRTENSFVKLPSNLKEFMTFDVLSKKDRLVLTPAITKVLTLFTFGIDLSKQSVYETLPRTLSKDAYDFVDTVPEKAAVTIDGNFADIRTPIKNLYLAGTDTDSRSMGITRAAYSIVEMLGVLNEDGNLHQ